MHRYGFFLCRIHHPYIMALFCLMLMTACGRGSSPAPLPKAGQTVLEIESSPVLSTTEAASVTTIPEPSPAQPTASDSAIVTSSETVAFQVDTCTLLDRAGIATTIGREVLEPKSEQLANLSCGSYGNPETPIISIVTVCAFVGSDAEYYAGAEAQAREIFEQGKNNAASIQLVSGLGNDAYWDGIFNSLHVLQRKYELSIEISLDSEDGETTLNLSKELALKALQRLP